jgi:hypothetical protein
MRSALLVADQDVMELGFSKGVIYWKNRAARIAKYVAHPEPL